MGEYYLPTAFTPAQLEELRRLAYEAREKHLGNDARGQSLHNLARRLDEYCDLATPPARMCTG